MPDNMSLEEFASIELLKDEFRKLQRKHADLREKRIDLEQVIENAARAAFSSQELPVAGFGKPDRRTKGEEVAVVMIADLQLGKVTPEYDSEIAEQRMGLYAQKVVGLTEIARAEHPVKRAHVWLLGDIVEGERIFPGQEYLIDSGLVDQVVGNGSRIIRNFLYEMLGNFETVHVTAVVGNHGRLGRPGEYHPETNMDRMLYRVVREWFAATGELGNRISFDIPTYYKGDRGWYAIDHIGQYSSLLIHGDQFRGGGGISGLPYPSMNKKVLKWRDAALAGRFPKFQDVACGHWHVDASIPIGTQVLRIAGSPESYNVWAQEFLSSTQGPTQRMMFVHPEKGMVTADYTIYLD